MTETSQTLARADAIEVADTLRVATNRAAALLEQLDTENETMKRASIGVLPDGTPVEDMLEELREVKAELQKLRKALREIGFYASRPASERATTVKLIQEVVAKV